MSWEWNIPNDDEKLFMTQYHHQSSGWKTQVEHVANIQIFWRFDQIQKLFRDILKIFRFSNWEWTEAEKITKRQKKVQKMFNFHFQHRSIIHSINPSVVHCIFIYINFIFCNSIDRVKIEFGKVHKRFRRVFRNNSSAGNLLKLQQLSSSLSLESG